MFPCRSFLCLSVLAVLLAGCKTAPTPPPRLESHQVTEAPVLVPAHDQEPEGGHVEPPPTEPPVVEAPAPPVVVTNAPALPAQQAQKAKPTVRWVDWESWLTEHGRPPIKVIPGSRRAVWAGAAVYLGFEPRPIQRPGGGLPSRRGEDL